MLWLFLFDGALWRWAAGAFCPAGSSVASVCKAGSWSGEGQGLCSNCSRGTYNGVAGSVSMAACALCPPGEDGGGRQCECSSPLGRASCGFLLAREIQHSNVLFSMIKFPNKDVCILEQSRILFHVSRTRECQCLCVTKPV